MLYTVFCTDDTPIHQWQSELLEYSWKKVGQRGNLIRLVATNDRHSLPHHEHAHSVACPKHEMRDGEQEAAQSTFVDPFSVAEWIRSSPEPGTVLMIGPESIFRAPLKREVSPGKPLSQSWNSPAIDHDDTPFGLGPDFWFLANHCNDTELKLQPVKLPTLIHTQDLSLIVDRWQELSSVIRENSKDHSRETIRCSHQFAYLIAASEHGLEHLNADLAVPIDEPIEAHAGASIIRYNHPVVDDMGQVIWDSQTYSPWAGVAQEELQQTGARELFEIIGEYVQRMSEAEAMTTIPIQRRQGIFESRVGDELMLEHKTGQFNCWLNSSAQAVWKLCRDNRTPRDIAQQLRQEFPAAPPGLEAEVHAAIGQLVSNRMLVRLWHHKSTPDQVAGDPLANREPV